MSGKEKSTGSKKRARTPAVEKASLFEQYAGWYLGAILLLALGLRIAALISLNGTVYVDFMLWDERIYHELAVRIADGTYASREVYEFAPVYAYLIAGIYRLFSPEIFYIRLLNILFGVLSCWVIYGIGVRLGSRKIALAACLLAALYKPFILYSIVPLKESLTVLLFALTVWLLLMTIENKEGRIVSGLLGFSMGLLFNVRPNAVILVPVLMLLVVWHRYKNGDRLRAISSCFGLYLLGLSLVVAPFVIRNCLVAGKFAVTTSQSGFNLYIGNNVENPDPYYRPVSFASSAPSEQGTHFTIEASRRTGRILSATEASNYWTREAIRQALDHPGAFTQKVIRKVLALFSHFEACDHYDIDFMSDFARFFKLPLFGFWFVFPLAMAGIAFRVQSDRRARALGLVLAVYAATLVIFFSNARYRIPMLSVLIPFAVLGCTDLMEMFRRRQFRRAGLFAVGVAVLVVVEFLPVRATDDRSAYYNTHAIILDSRGFGNEAILYWRQSSAMNRAFSAFANLALARKSFQRGLVSDGYAYLDLILDTSFAAAQKYDIMGDMLIRQRRVNEAILAYERSLAINSGQRRTLYKLIQIYKKTNPGKVAGLEARLKYISSFYSLLARTEMPK